MDLTRHNLRQPRFLYPFVTTSQGLQIHGQQSSNHLVWLFPLLVWNSGCLTWLFQKQIIVNTGLFWWIKFVALKCIFATTIVLLNCMQVQQLTLWNQVTYSCQCDHKVDYYLGLLLCAISLNVLHSLWGKGKNRQYEIRAVKNISWSKRLGCSVHSMGWCCHCAAAFS